MDNLNGTPAPANPAGGPAQPSLLHSLTEEDWAKAFALHTLPFLAALAGVEDATHLPFQWQVVDDPKAGRVPPRHWSASFAEAGPLLMELQKAGAGVFVTVNATDGKGRSKANVTHARAVWCDYDTDVLPSGFPLKPTMRVQTGKGWHFYWLLKTPEAGAEPMTPQALERINKGIAQKFGMALAEATSLQTVLRVPGFWHQKDPANLKFISLHTAGGPRYSLEELSAAFPFAGAPARASSGMDRDTKVDATDAERAWAHAAALTYVRTAPPAVEGNGGDNTTFTVAAKLADFVDDDRAALALLAEWNRRCMPPWSPDDLRRKWEHAKRYRQNPLMSAVLEERVRAALTNMVRPRAAPPTPEAVLPDGGTVQAPEQITSEDRTGEDGPVILEGFAIRPPGPPPPPEDELEFQINDKGNLIHCPLNIFLTLARTPAWADVLAYDEMRGVILKVAPPPYAGSTVGVWTDADTAETVNWMNHRQLRQSENVVLSQINLMARKRTVHPVRDFLKGLPPWDGVPRVDRWLERYAGARLRTDDDTDRREYVSKVGRYFLIAGVARVMEPGCKVDNVLILEGRQGVKKSTLLRTLAVRDDWFTDSPVDMESKDGMMALRGKWIVELPELDALDKASAAAAKRFFSSQTDYFRAPYGRTMETVHRQCVIAGSVNHTEYLKDETGGRRYWPIYCQQIDIEGLRGVRGQLWAEALHLYSTDNRWWAEGEELEAFQAEQKARMQDDAWEHEVMPWLQRQEAGRLATTGDILTVALGMETKDITKSAEIRLGLFMSRVKGWESARFVRDGHKKRGWVKKA